jgi:hypothetical protein
LLLFNYLFDLFLGLVLWLFALLILILPLIKLCILPSFGNQRIGHPMISLLHSQSLLPIILLQELLQLLGIIDRQQINRIAAFQLLLLHLNLQDARVEVTGHLYFQSAQLLAFVQNRKVAAEVVES